MLHRGTKRDRLHDRGRDALACRKRTLLSLLCFLVFLYCGRFLLPPPPHLCVRHGGGGLYANPLRPEASCLSLSLSHTHSFTRSRFRMFVSLQQRSGNSLAIFSSFFPAFCPWEDQSCLNSLNEGSRHSGAPWLFTGAQGRGQGSF